MIYKRILESLFAGESSVLVTVIASEGIGKLPVGRMRFLSPGGKTGDLGDEWLNREADRLANQALESGELKRSLLFPPGRPGGQVALMAEPFFMPEELVVLGGGNIAQPLVRMAALLGYTITVVDDRPEFTDPVLFPDAAHLICEDFERALEQIPFGPWSSVVIITRGHKHDLTCMKKLVDRDLAYLGMIGSRRKIKQICDYFYDRGVPEDGLGWIHMPIGLDIGAQTPAEIAVSIAAELVKVRRAGKAGSLAAEAESCITAVRRRGAGSTPGEDVKVLQGLAEYAAQEIPAVIATVVSTKGSTPRKAGAKMLIYQDGRSQGTIGGGCLEGEVRREALGVLDEGVPKLFHYRLDSELAAGAGMVCGGNMEVFLAPVARGEE